MRSDRVARALALAVLFAQGALVAGCRGRVGGDAGPPEGELWIPAEAFQRGETRTVEVRTQDLPRAIVVGGRIAFDDEMVSHVFSPVSGRVTRVLAQLGQQVRRGTPLVAIRSPDVGAAFSDDVKARADLEAARRDLDRQRKLFGVNAASGRDLEAAEDAFGKARAEADRARQRLSLLTPESIDAVTQEYTLPSHIDGRVIARTVNPGAEVQGQFGGGTAQELFTVGRIDTVWVYADVPEGELREVRVGAPVAVRVLAYPERTFRGQVEWVSPALDPALRTARIRCSLPNPDALLKPEMYAAVAVERPPQRALALPRQAVTRINEQSFVYVAAGARPDGKKVFQRRRVELPERSGSPQRRPDAEAYLPLDLPGADQVPVLGGVGEGEQVLVDEGRTGERAAGEVVVPKDQLGKLAVVPVEQRDVPDAVTIGGRLGFDDMRVTHVFSPVNGRITQLRVAPGHHVKKGTPLALILSPDLGSAFSDVLKAKADLVAAEHELKRQQEMFEVKASSERDVEAAANGFARAKAEYDRAELKTRLLREGALDAVTQEYVLRSPIDGDVVARMANPGLEVQGQYSGSSAPELFTIGRIDQLWMIGDLYEVDLPYVKPGAEVELRVAAFPERVFRGTVDWISDALDPVQRTAKVRCVLANPGGLLRPEMYGTARISAPIRRALTVPREAILRAGDETVVFVEGPRAPDGRQAFTRKPVVASEQLSGDTVPVLAGLVAGERVVSRGAVFLLGAF
jgi:cobalt-zinc-cadmium efflux system membrane fusion protein